MVNGLQEISDAYLAEYGVSILDMMEDSKNGNLEAFEQKRKLLVKNFIESHPKEKRDLYHKVQEDLEKELNAIEDPIERCIVIVRAMVDINFKDIKKRTQRDTEDGIKKAIELSEKNTNH